MQRDIFTRTISLIGDDAFSALQRAKVVIVGVGGVGSYAAEAIARAGIGRITLVDGDSVAPSNINRQLIALHSTIGHNKAELMAERIMDINPDVKLEVMPIYYKNSDDLDLTEYDFVVDAIDDVDAKINLIASCVAQNVRIISAMGAAGKFDTAFKVADIAATKTCPLAKIVRKKLREQGIEHLPVVYSEEKPTKCEVTLGTMSYVPGAAGLELAGYVIKELISKEAQK